MAADGLPWIPAERIRWNAFRHTFGSLLAQAGVSLDKISAWMGNTPEVCRRHYAEFVPRDARDDEIDRL
jgi:integrase